MADGFMSAWSAPAAATRLDWARSLATYEGASFQRLPAVHFHATTLMDLRRALLYASPATGPSAFGVLRGFRSSPPDDNILFDSHLPQAAVAAIRPGAVVLPLGAAAISHRPWREGRIGGDGSILKLFGATASPTLVHDGRGVELCVTVSLPNISLLRWPALSREHSPNISQVSLGIVLCGGDTVREGEHIGFLVRGKGDPDVLEPVLLNDTVGRRAIVGMWTLSGRDLWTAAAVFAADSMTRRNAKVGRPGTGMSNAAFEAKRQVRFVIAQFRERLGGAPTFFPCELSLPTAAEPQHITFRADVLLQCDDATVKKGGVVSAHFASESLSLPHFAENRPYADVAGGARAKFPAALGQRDAASSADVERDDGARLGNLPETNPLLGSDGVSPASQARLQLNNISEQMRQLNSEIGLFSSQPAAALSNRDAQTDTQPGSAVGPSSASDVGVAAPNQAPREGPRVGPRPLFRGAPAASHNMSREMVDRSLNVEDGAASPELGSKPGTRNAEVEDYADEISPQLDQIARKYIGPGY